MRILFEAVQEDSMPLNIYSCSKFSSHFSEVMKHKMKWSWTYVPLIPTRMTVCPLLSLFTMIWFTSLLNSNPFSSSHLLLPSTTWYCCTLPATPTKVFLYCSPSPINLTAMLASLLPSCLLTNWLTSVTVHFKPCPGNAWNSAHLPNWEVWSSYGDKRNMTW